MYDAAPPSEIPNGTEKQAHTTINVTSRVVQ